MERFSGKGRKYVCGRKIRKEISVTGPVMGIVEDKCAAENAMIKQLTGTDQSVGRC